MGEPELVAVEGGFLLLRLLSLQGWQVDVRADGDGGVIVSASRGDVTVQRSGGSVAEVAVGVATAAGRWRHFAAASLRSVRDPSGPQRDGDA